MKRFLILVLTAAAILAVALPTHAIAAPNYDKTMSLDCFGAVAINAADSGGSLLLVSDLHRAIDLRTHYEADVNHATLNHEQHFAAFGGGLLFDANEVAKFDPGSNQDAIACRPLRAIGRGLRGLGRGFGRAFGRAGSC